MGLIRGTRDRSHVLERGFGSNPLRTRNMNLMHRWWLMIYYNTYHR